MGNPTDPTPVCWENWGRSPSLDPPVILQNPSGAVVAPPWSLEGPARGLVLGQLCGPTQRHLDLERVCISSLRQVPCSCPCPVVCSGSQSLLRTRRSGQNPRPSPEARAPRPCPSSFCSLPALWLLAGPGWSPLPAALLPWRPNSSLQPALSSSHSPEAPTHQLPWADGVRRAQAEQLHALGP